VVGIGLRVRRRPRLRRPAVFAPNLPRAWNELAFSLRFCGRQIRVQLAHDDERYLVEMGDPLNVTIRDEPYMLSPGTPVAIKVPPR
jgi:alpha,alpha-trehalose phosphorylase